MGSFQECCCKNKDSNGEMDIEKIENNKNNTAEIISKNRKIIEIEDTKMIFKSSIHNNSDSESFAKHSLKESIPLSIFFTQNKIDTLDDINGKNETKDYIDKDVNKNFTYMESLNNYKDYEPSNVSLSIKERKNFFTVVRLENSKDNKDVLRKKYTRPNFLKSSKNTYIVDENQYNEQNFEDRKLEENGKNKTNDRKFEENEKNKKNKNFEFKKNENGLSSTQENLNNGSEANEFNGIEEKIVYQNEQKLFGYSAPNEKSSLSVDRNIFINKFTSSRLRDTELQLECFDKFNCNNFDINIEELIKLEENPDIVFEEGKCKDGYLYYGGVSSKNSKKTGYGIQLFSNGVKYEGFFLDDEYHLYGRLITVDQIVFEGNFKNGKLNGKCREFNDKYLFQGMFIDGKKSGYGTYTSNDYNYEGNYENNVKNGYGKLQLKVGSKFTYEGSFVNDQFSGKGKITFRNKNIYEGEFSNGQMNGLGKMIYRATNESYVGDFVNGKREGFGKYFRGDKLTYKGNYINDLAHGKGFIIRDGKEIEVEMLEGRLKSDN